MLDVKLPKLKDDQIRKLLLDQNVWPLEDMIIFGFGYDYSNYSWGDFRGNTNADRCYHTALSAIKAGKLKDADTILCNGERTRYEVTKKSYFFWAIDEWRFDMEVSRAYQLWVRHRKARGRSYPDHSSLMEKSRDFAKIILTEYLDEHVKYGGTAQNFKFSKGEIDNEVRQRFPIPKRELSTIKKDYSIKGFLNAIVTEYFKNAEKGK